MAGVAEPDKLRELIDALPGDGMACRGQFADGRLVSGYGPVTAHAERFRRERHVAALGFVAGGAGEFRRGMHTVAERYGLNGGQVQQEGDEQRITS